MSCDGPRTSVLPSSTERPPAPGPLHTTTALLRPPAASLLRALTCRLLRCLQTPNDPERASVKEICSLHFDILEVKKKAHYRDRPGRGGAPHGPPLSSPRPTRPGHLVQTLSLSPSRTPLLALLPPHSVMGCGGLSGQSTRVRAWTDGRAYDTRTCTHSSANAGKEKRCPCSPTERTSGAARQSFNGSFANRPRRPGLGEPALVKSGCGSLR